MWRTGAVKVLIIGDGARCGPLLKGLDDVYGVRLTGFVDVHSRPESLEMCRRRAVPLYNRIEDALTTEGADVVLYAGAEPALAERFSLYCRGRAQFMHAKNARLLRLLAAALRRTKRIAAQYHFSPGIVRASEHGRGAQIVGKSPAVERLRELIIRVAPTPASILLTGETGTGKDLAARSIHQQSHLARKPFVAVNCTALTETLMESELFGYVKGAFTGADRDRKGLLEEADGGTLFLDEIGDMHSELQAKLLRFLQSGEVRRVGSTKSRQVNVRIIAATNRILEADVERGAFRRDLFYRFNTFTIHLPALRERREDIPYLAYHFITSTEAKLNRRISGISDPALAVMARYDWPGNIRELENVVERAAILSGAGRIEVEDLALPVTEVVTTGRAVPFIPSGGSAAASDADEEGEGFHDKRQQIMDTFERKEIMQYLRQAGGNVSEAARLSGIPRRTLYRKMKKHGL